MLTDYLKAIALGIVEGITEWLPISSTGHLILLEELLSLDAPNRLGEEFAAQYSAMFSVVIQLGAILAVAVFYLKALLPTTKDSRALWVKLALATLPAALIGLLADALCERAFGKSLDSLLFCPEVVASALIIYGLLFIVVERLTGRKQSEVCSVTEIDLPTALAIGCFQSLALIPGTSRSGATVLGARLLGIDRRAAAEFSFFAALPVIASASALKLVDFTRYARASGVSIPSDALLLLLVSGIVAFLTSLLSIRFLTGFIKKHTFIPFGIYRIILGVAVLMLRGIN